MKIISQIKNIVLFHLDDPPKRIVEDALNGSKDAYVELCSIMNDLSDRDSLYLEYIIDLIDVYATDGNIEIENIVLAPE